MKELFHKIFVKPTTNIWIQFIRYGFVGGVAFLADYGSLFFFAAIVGLHYLLSAAIAFVIGLTVNYLLSISYVFSASRKTEIWVEFTVFLIIGVVGLGLNELIMWCGCDMLNLHYMIVKLISTGIVFFWNFLARKFILF